MHWIDIVTVINALYSKIMSDNTFESFIWIITIMIKLVLLVIYIVPLHKHSFKINLKINHDQSIIN